MMEIYEFAIQMEIDGEKYYRNLEQKCSSAGLRKIFRLLADEEVRHRLLLESLREKTAPATDDSEILNNVKNIFLSMKEEETHWTTESKEAIEAFQKAYAIEDMGKKFYLQKAKEAKDEQAKAILTMLAEEEECHARIMENIVEFISRPEPGYWLENAEWHHLEEY
jgi:rubrerythrin